MRLSRGLHNPPPARAYYIYTYTTKRVLLPLHLNLVALVKPSKKDIDTNSPRRMREPLPLRACLTFEIYQISRYKIEAQRFNVNMSFGLTSVSDGLKNKS